MLVNPYSLSIIALFVALLLIALTISSYKDKKDIKYLSYAESPYYDTMQHNLAIFTKEKLHEKYNLFRLFLYLIRVS